jgi:hypothetical protein
MSASLSMMTSVIRSDEVLRCQNDTSGPASDATHPISAIENMRSRLRNFSDIEVATLEDELDFYTFTGIAGSTVKKLLAVI